MELGRKPLDSMRWEELWDTALRIRSKFLATPVPRDVEQEVSSALASLDLADVPCAVRSSAPGEDALGRSFAGLHESVVGSRGVASVLDAVRIVWASLWSDAALLYRKEFSLDPLRSRMAVVVQRMVDARTAGVMFTRSPTTGDRSVVAIEGAWGLGSAVVSGEVTPDRWVVAKLTDEISVRDNGTGMSEETKEKIFEPLYSTKGFGVGLGMVIVKNIVEQHHGQIQIDSEEGKGTTVTVCLPLNPPTNLT